MDTDATEAPSFIFVPKKYPEITKRNGTANLASWSIRTLRYFQAAAVSPE
jgi:hypothetical protein